MKTNYIKLLVVLIMFTSCGKSKEQKELEKTKLELQDIKAKLESERIMKIFEQKSNVGKKKIETSLREILEKAKKSKEQKRRELRNAKEFKIGRTIEQKQNQLNKLNKAISDLESYIRGIKNEISQLEYRKTFEFQKSPEKILLNIFNSAKNQDLSNLRYLCDPFAENDSDTKSICFAEMMTPSMKSSFYENFAKGRIMGKTEIKDSIATIEFAFGSSSNRLEKMNFIKRNGNWYLLSF